MKKTTAVLLVMVMVFCLSGERLSAYGEEKKIYKQKKKELDYEGEEIKADLRHVDLIVRTSRDGGFYLKYDVSSKKGKNPLLVSTKDGVLSLKEKNAGAASWYKGISIEGIKMITEKGGYKNVVTLYVPADRQINFTADLRDGDLELQGIQIKSADITMKDGDLEIQGGQIKSADITMKDGDLELSDMTIQGGTVTAGDGDIEAENTELFRNVQIKSGDGDISLELGPSCRDILSISADTEMDLEVSKELGGELFRKGERISYRRTVEGSEDRLTVRSEDGDITLLGTE